MTTATTEQSTAAKKSRKRTKVTHKDILQASVATNQELAKIIQNTGKMVSTEMRLAKDQKDQNNEGRLANRSQNEQQSKHWQLRANKPTFVKALLDKENKPAPGEQKSTKPVSAPRQFKPTLTPLAQSKLVKQEAPSPVTESAKPLADRWRRILADPIVTAEQQKHGEAKAVDTPKAAPAPKGALAPKGKGGKGGIAALVYEILKGGTEAAISVLFPGDASVGGNMDSYAHQISSGSEAVKDITTWTVYWPLGGVAKGVF